MGMRAIAKINGSGYYKHWGSPQFQLRHLALWLHTHSLSHSLPTAGTYEALCVTLNLDGFTEPYPQHTYPGDLDWFYTITVDGEEDEWTAGIQVLGPQLFTKGWRDVPTEPVEFECTVTPSDLRPLTDQVARYARAMAGRDFPKNRQGWEVTAAQWADWRPTG